MTTPREAAEKYAKSIPDGDYYPVDEETLEAAFLAGYRLALEHAAGVAHDNNIAAQFHGGVGCDCEGYIRALLSEDT